jgi:uncharacterized protein (DUF1778 family)
MGAAKEYRINFSISREQKELIQHASALMGFKSVSEFIISCVSREVKDIISQNDLILKSIAAKKGVRECVDKSSCT